MPIAPVQTTSESTLLGQTPQTTAESSTAIRRNWDEELKQRSIFSARTTSQKYVEAVKRLLGDVASRKMTPQMAEERLRSTLQDLGYRPETGFSDGSGVPPAKPGDIRDLSASRRIQLILDTNIKQAISLGQIAASEDPMQMMMNPAWELRRMGARKKPRGDWKKRWAAAGDRCGWKGALKKKMVALKISPIWQAIADGAGGFKDTLGSPYPPFAFGSGLAWASVGRGAWKKMCAAEGVPDGLDDVTAKAKELKGRPKKTPQEATEGHLARFGGELPGGGRRQEAVSPLSGLFKADFRSRIKADDAIDGAVREAAKIRDTAQKCVSEMADLRTECGKLAGDRPLGERRRLLTSITDRRSAVGKAAQEIDGLWGRVINYGGAVGSTPVPRDEASQRAFDETMARYAAAAARTVRKARTELHRLEMLMAAARKTAERMRELKDEFKPDMSRKTAALEAIGRAEGVLSSKAGRPGDFRNSLTVYEQANKADKAKWPAANFFAGDQLLSTAKSTVAMLEQMLVAEKDGLTALRALVGTTPDPVDEASQKRFDESMDARAAEAEEAARKVADAFAAFRLADTINAIEKATQEAIEAEKKRICDGIYADAQTRTADVVGNQVADILADKKTVDKAAKADGVSIHADSPVGKAWTKAYNAARSARSNVRKLLGELKTECDRADVPAAKTAQVKFQNAIDYCLKRYGALETMLEDWKAELERLKAAQKAPAPQTAVQTPAADKGRTGALPHDESAFPKSITKEDIDNAKGGIGGSTGARLLTDPLGRRFILKQTNATKPGDGQITREHLENEIATDRIYRAAGIKVPDVREYEVDGKPVKLTTFVPNARPLGDWMRTATAAQKEKVRAKLAKGFLVDAVLANWDVVGQGMDNILIDEDGEPWRIDNGSGMRFRARGVAKKEDEWEKSSFPDEWRTLRDQNPAVFGNLTAYDIFSQVVDWDAVVDATPEKDRPVVERRAKEMKEMQRRCKNFEAGKFTPASTSDILEKSYDACRSGVRDAMPNHKVGAGNFGSLRPSKSSASSSQDEYSYADTVIAAAKSINYHAATDQAPNTAKVSAALSIKPDLEKLAKKDANAKKLLGAVQEIEKSAAGGYHDTIGTVSRLKVSGPKKAKKESVTEKLIEFVEKGGDPKGTRDPKRYQFIKDWASSQAGDSWNTDACKAKIFEFELRGKNPDPSKGVMQPNGRLVGPDGELYGFKIGGSDRRIANYKAAWDYYKRNPDEMDRDREAFRNYKAGVQVVLENLDCDNNDPDSGTMILCRTEQKSVMQMDNMKKGQFGRMMRSGAESHSIFETVVIGGANQLTVVRVPYSRISGTYFLSRSDKGESMFLGDGENEFNVDINNGDLPVYYAGQVYAGENTAPYVEEFIKAEKREGLSPLTS